ncbi:hypothetical protein SLS56_010257 [Neofusicoccum ribis]|uniref:Uncharacterized protein n=1 Tax=Neofusicoccum ribis TaxID=45134 RepID=A0ABR3SEY1_9PEZI
MSPPSGPASNIPMSAHTRPGNPLLSAPSRPRGGGRGGFGGGPGRDFQPYESPGGAPPLGPRRGSGAWGPRGGGPGPAGYGGPPSGPRGGPPAFRGSSNSTSTTYPRTQRFNNVAAIPPTGPAAAAAAINPGAPTGPPIPTGPAGTASLNVTNLAVAQHLADLPTIVPGGIRQKDIVDTSRLQKLEDESRRLREAIAEKEAAGRRGKREWERLEREGETMALRAELADEHLRSLNGEGELGGAAF